MTVALLCIADGRFEYHAAAYASLLEHAPKFDQYIWVNDPDHRLGFSGAVQQGWSQVETDYVLHWEADFVADRPIPVDAMVSALEANPHLVQMVLLRQPWNDRERAAGGIVQLAPGDFTRVEQDAGCWLEHRRFVSTNPALWPRSVIDRGWPSGPESEGRFGVDLFASDPGLRAAFWGAGEEWVEHIGRERAGRGY